MLDNVSCVRKTYYYHISTNGQHFHVAVKVSKTKKNILKKLNVKKIQFISRLKKAEEKDNMHMYRCI